MCRAISPTTASSPSISPSWLPITASRAANPTRSSPASPTWNARASLYRRGNIDASTRQVCCRGDIGRALVYRARPTRQHPAFTVVPARGRTGATPLEIGSNNELARRGGALRAVWQADSQRPVGRCAEHDHLVLLTKVEQTQALAAAPQTRLPAFEELGDGLLQPMVHAAYQRLQQLAPVDVLAARDREAGGRAGQRGEVGWRRVDVYTHANDRQ